MNVNAHKTLKWGHMTKTCLVDTYGFMAFSRAFLKSWRLTSVQAGAESFPARMRTQSSSSMLRKASSSITRGQRCQGGFRIKLYWSSNNSTILRKLQWTFPGDTHRVCCLSSIGSPRNLLFSHLWRSVHSKEHSTLLELLCAPHDRSMTVCIFH